ncbi:hypothetical protein [Phaffia rhodozyma]|uniref:Vacuolar membrane protein n=1 Tax=Phaffia rhodozyma TaxID=264483 RepID=A0A0F7SRM6_PHARH|nr:hypothetical protein [Phaffia rhodozyma]
MGFKAKWKREIVPDHKVAEYRATGFLIRSKYLFLYIGVLISIGVHCANIYTAITMLLATGWTNSIYTKCGDDCVLHVGFLVTKWIFVGCIIVSFLLLAYEANKARKVIGSRDISFAFTNLMANHYYSLRSYPHFCFFDHIQSSTKKSDDFAFFVFFTFKCWKTLLVADAPRQVINALTLYSFGKVNKWQTDDISLYYDGNWVTAIMLLTMIFTVVVFAANLILLISAAILYIPLLIYIQGNLKEYCCHKIDKRIAELIKRKQKQRIARNAAYEKRMAGADGSNGIIGLNQPTLPNVLLDEDEGEDEEGDIKKPLRRLGAPIDGFYGNPSTSQGHLVHSESNSSLTKVSSLSYGHVTPLPYHQPLGTAGLQPQGYHLNGGRDYLAYGQPPPMPMYQPPGTTYPIHQPPSLYPPSRSQSRSQLQLQPQAQSRQVGRSESFKLNESAQDVLEGYYATSPGGYDGYEHKQPTEQAQTQAHSNYHLPKAYVPSQNITRQDSTSAYRKGFLPPIQGQAQAQYSHQLQPPTSFHSPPKSQKDSYEHSSTGPLVTRNQTMNDNSRFGGVDRVTAGGESSKGHPLSLSPNHAQGVQWSASGQEERTQSGRVDQNLTPAGYINEKAVYKKSN